MQTEDLHIAWRDQNDLPEANYARVLVRITETDDGEAECPLWDVWTWHNQGQLYGFQLPDGQFLNDATYRPVSNRIRRFEWTYLSWAAHEKMIEDFGRKGAPAVVYCVLRCDCESEDELQQVFDTREAAQDYIDHLRNTKEYYVGEYDVRTENPETGPLLWHSIVLVLDTETNLKIAQRGVIHPSLELSQSNDKEGWVQYCEGQIFFWFMADNRAEAIKKARDIARTIIKDEAEGKYPFLRRRVFRTYANISPLICPYYDIATGEIILSKSGRIEIPRSEMQFADDGTVLSPKFKVLDKDII